MPSPNRYYNSAALPTVLSSAIVSPSATSMSVPSSPASLNWPSSFPYQLTLDPGTAGMEVVLVTASSGSGPYTLTITRGIDGTTGATHAVTSVNNVFHAVSGHDFGEYQAHAIATGPTTYGPDSNPVAVHGIGGGSAVVGTTDSQTLTNKTLTSPVINTPNFNNSNSNGLIGSFNVKDIAYGATGNGATDDTAAIQAAIAAAAASSNNATVFFPAGLYRISQITLPAGVTLRGAHSSAYGVPGGNMDAPGWPVSVLARVASTNLHMVMLADTQNYQRMYDLGIDGNKNNNVTGDGIHIEDGTLGQEGQQIIQRCFIFNQPGSGIYLGHNRRCVKVLDCVSNYSATADGVSVANSDSTIQGCIFGSNTTGAGIGLGTTTGTRFAASSSRTDTTGTTTTSGSATVGDTHAVAADAGCIIAGAGIPAWPITYIKTVNAGTGYTISQNATANGTPTLYIGGTSRTDSTGVTVTNASTTVGDTHAVAGDLGLLISGTGITPGTFISAVNAGTGYTISAAATAGGATSIVVGNGFSGTSSASIIHVLDNDIYQNVVGIALNSAAWGCMIQNNGMDRNTNEAITVFDGDSNSIVGNAFHSNGTQTNNTYGHIGIASGVTCIRIDGNSFAPLDSGISNVASYGVVSATTTASAIMGDLGTLSATSTVNGLISAKTGSFASTTGKYTGQWMAPDSGLVAWAFDIVGATANSLLTTAGTLYLVRMHVPVACSVTNVLIQITTAGATLTASQCFAGLWNSAGTQIGITANQATLWQTAGLQTMALAGGPFTIPAGDYLVGFYYNGTTAPTLSRGQNSGGTPGVVNLGSSTLRFSTANTGLTTTPPAPLGAQTGTNLSFWAGIS